MNIVFYSHTGYLGNGGAESLLAIVSLLNEKYNCLVVTPNKGSLNVTLDKKGIPNMILPFTWSSDYNNSFNNRKTFAKMKLISKWLKNYFLNIIESYKHVKILKTKEIDFIYGNTSVFNIGSKVAERLNVPHVWHLREFQFNESKITPDFGKRNLSKSLLKSDLLIANSYALKNFYQTFVGDKKIEVVYNGIGINNQNIKIKDKGCFRFLMVGFLIENKGHKEAIIAAKELKDAGNSFILDIVGDGFIKNELIALVQNLGLQNEVVFHGQKENVSSFYSKADCYLMCSTVESFGRVIVEAMLYQLPVIGKLSEYTATKEIIRDKVDGLHYKISNDLVSKMEYLICNRGIGIEMGKSGFKRAKDNFSIELCVNNISRILKDYLKQY